MSYNPSIFDDKISVTAQLEEVKKVLDAGGAEVTQSDLDALESKIKNTTGALDVRLDAAEEDIVLVDNGAKLALSMAQNIAERCLKTPVSVPIATQLVAVNSANAQEMITLGSGLSIEDGIINTTGGGAYTGQFIHFITFRVHNESYLPNPSYGQLILLLNTGRNFTGTVSDEDPDLDYGLEGTLGGILANAMIDAGYKTVCVDVSSNTSSGSFTTLSFRPEASTFQADTSDGELLYVDSFTNFKDRVIPV